MKSVVVYAVSVWVALELAMLTLEAVASVISAILD